MTPSLRLLCGATGVAIALSVAAAGQVATPGQIAPAPPRQATPTRDRQTPSKGSAVLRGHVVDSVTGQPLRRVSIDAYAQSGVGKGGAVTDAEGRFEIRNLPAGRYTVGAFRVGFLRTSFGQRLVDGPGTPIEVLDGQTVDKIVLRMMRGGVITGRVVDEFGDPVINAEVHALRYQFQGGSRRLGQVSGGFGPANRTDDLGMYRLYGLPPGQYYVSARPSDTFTRVQVAEPTAPAPSFFPNSPDPSGAQRVTVNAGRETTGINIALSTTRVVRVRGRAVQSSGEPFAGGFINFFQRDETGSGFSFNRGAQVAADGTFEAVAVLPGRYTLTVRMPNARDDDDAEIGHASVVVSNEDIDNVMIVGSRGAILRGSLITEDGEPMPLRPSSLMVGVRPAPNEAFQGASMRPTRVQDDYSFELKGLFGRLRLSSNITMDPGTSAGGPTWSQKTVLWRGEDVTDRGFEFEPGQIVEGVQIVYSRRWAELSGTVTDDRGNALGEAWLVLFPTDENRWTGESRYVRATRSNPQGEYRFQRLHAADSFLAAVHDMEPGQAQDPDFLRTLRDRATRVAIVEGTTHTQNLRVGQAPQ